MRLRDWRFLCFHVAKDTPTPGLHYATCPPIRLVAADCSLSKPRTHAGAEPLLLAGRCGAGDAGSSAELVAAAMSWSGVVGGVAGCCLAGTGELRTGELRLGWGGEGLAVMGGWMPGSGCQAGRYGGDDDWEWKCAVFDGEVLRRASGSRCG
ncbi:hypothetical protein BKA80DRAFT_111830 [Phyllosticta citrichinensis]